MDSNKFWQNTLYIPLMQLVNLPDCSTNSRYYTLTFSFGLMWIVFDFWLSFLFSLFWCCSSTLCRALSYRVWKIQPATESSSPSVRKVNWHEARDSWFGMSIHFNLLLSSCFLLLVLEYLSVFIYWLTLPMCLSREMLHPLITYWMKKAGSWPLHCFLTELHLKKLYFGRTNFGLCLL